MSNLYGEVSRTIVEIKTEEEKDVLVCNVCGGKNIETKVWSDPNTGEVLDSCNGDYEDNWCRDCEDNVYFVKESEFVPNEDDDDE